MGHWFVIPLCEHPHHWQVHARRKRFEEAFGTQRSLWEALNKQLGIERDWPMATKILARRSA
jgi:hypothetical protein